MLYLFQEIFYRPILNCLIFLYNNVPGNDLGIAIILLTIIIKIILHPLSIKSLKSQKELQDITPKINELKKKFKDDKQGLAKATMDLYKEHKINPFSSCLPLLLQFPFLIAVYRVFLNGVDKKLDLIYPFIYRPETINFFSFGFLDLSKPNVALAVLAGVAQFFQAKTMMAKKPKNVESDDSKGRDMSEMMNKQMLYLMPALTVFIGVSLPGGLTLYWFVLTLLTVLQQWYVFRKKQKNIVSIEKAPL